MSSTSTDIPNKMLQATARRLNPTKPDARGCQRKTKYQQIPGAHIGASLPGDILTPYKDLTRVLLCSEASLLSSSCAVGPKGKVCHFQWSPSPPLKFFELLRSSSSSTVTTSGPTFSSCDVKGSGTEEFWVKGEVPEPRRVLVQLRSVLEGLNTKFDMFLQSDVLLADAPGTHHRVSELH
ncbi:hypothetical protein QQF64_022557 [Cirrhinus molitorella]|uniref:Uncharacterized protein n=1 Tax=Cirrhinus molitorella TaxID=172907 RepID=A0ABR3L564_9TELE